MLYRFRLYSATELIKMAKDKVGDKAFDGASKLKTLTFKGNLKSVKLNALNGCKKLKVVKVANKGDIKLIKKVLKKSLGAKAAKKVVVKKI